jgi:hypothetical protein
MALGGKRGVRGKGGMCNSGIISGAVGVCCRIGLRYEYHCGCGSIHLALDLEEG